MALIGIDIGTTAVKAVLADERGRRLAEYAAPYRTRRDGALAEQTPQDWLTHVHRALEGFAAADVRVAAIGVTSQVNTHVFCDRGLAPLRPAIVWQDGRAADAGAALDARIGTADKVAALGAQIPIDASHALARMAWVAENEPVIWAETAHVMLPKDWVIAQLTGAVGADPISAVGLVGPELRYASGVLGLMPRADKLLPPLADPLDVAGHMRKGPFAGVPVVRGTMDAWASMFGTGVAEEGQAMNLSGTSEVLGLVSSARHPEPGVVTFPEWAGITLHAGPTQAGGASLDWLERIIGRSPTELANLAEARPIASAAPLFLPHLSGERAPLWDAGARGVFAGLSASDGPAQMVLAVMEGVAFSARLALEALERAGGLRPKVIQAGGGGTASDVWCQIRADVFGRPLRRMCARDAGAVGAMVLAGVGAGLLPDLVRATRALVPEDRMFMPDPAATVRADARYAVWRELFAANRPVQSHLGAVG